MMPDLGKYAATVLGACGIAYVGEVGVVEQEQEQPVLPGVRLAHQNNATIAVAVVLVLAVVVRSRL